MLKCKGSAHCIVAVTNYQKKKKKKKKLSGLKTTQIYLIALEVKISKLKC